MDGGSTPRGFQRHLVSSCIATVMLLLQGWYVATCLCLHLPIRRCFADHAASFRQLSVAADGSASTAFRTSCSRTELPVIPSWPRFLGGVPSRVALGPKRIPGFIFGAVSETISELNLVGEWNVNAELSVTPERLKEQVLKQAGSQSSLDKGKKRRHNLLLVLRELCRSARLVLHNDRQGTLQPSGDTPDHRIPKAIWQLKRRPFSDLVVEIEFAFPPDDPEYILVLSAPVRPGEYFPNSIRVGEGSAWIAASPFLPWQKTKVATFTMEPKVMKSIIDPVLM
ncbi:transmembrane protein [Cystoisospora suis]|uniref:Transmembrane protein n=1 Tax=Cystoisospora suis TaxID=483139 RepID=A0A2C6KEC5_9APIC|nr:transmembrane protein [Cystoisospora suis]